MRNEAEMHADFERNDRKNVKGKYNRGEKSLLCVIMIWKKTGRGLFILGSGGANQLHLCCLVFVLKGERVR